VKLVFFREFSATRFAETSWYSGLPQPDWRGSGSKSVRQP
jgi:hypothetical protein